VYSGSSSSRFGQHAKCCSELLR